MRSRAEIFAGTVGLTLALAGAAPAQDATGATDDPISSIVQIEDDARFGSVAVISAPPASRTRQTRNAVLLTQRGEGNVFRVVQEGRANVLAASQLGERNDGDATQIGLLNNARIVQVGKNNTADGLLQVGVGRVAVWRQIGNDLGGVSIRQGPTSPPVMVTQTSR